MLSANDFTLTESDRQLILELLDREEKSLSVEIHHSRTVAFRDELRHRLAHVTALAEAIRRVTRSPSPAA